MRQLSFADLLIERETARFAEKRERLFREGRDPETRPFDPEELKDAYHIWQYDCQYIKDAW